MSEHSSDGSVFDLCKAAAVAASSKTNHPRVYPLSIRGQGVTGAEKQIITCIVEPIENEHGLYAGERLHPIVAAIQQLAGVPRHLRRIELRPYVSLDGSTGILYRKLPYGRMKPSSWVESAERAVYASIEEWGHFSADHIVERYTFVPMDDPPELPSDMPDLKALFEELLLDSVITSKDHPVIKRLLGNDPAASESNNGVY